MVSPLLLVPIAPSLALALTAGYAPELLPLALGGYYLLPLVLFWLGRAVAGKWLLAVPQRLKEHPFRLYAMVLSLPYPAYWVVAGGLGDGFGSAYLAFLRGPGVAVPLAVVMLYPLGAKMPPALASGLALAGSILAEQLVRRLVALSQK